MDSNHIKSLLGLPNLATPAEIRKEWEKRTSQVCKPCWELKYCPYGPLVEQFPLAGDCEDARAKLGIEKACSIFGHVCPVFLVNEPFTESKAKRRVSRAVNPRTMMRVARRDNYICQVCGKGPLMEKDIEFDHIIPYALGGCSDESNIQILCKACNQKKTDDVSDVLNDHAYTVMQTKLIAVLKKKRGRSL